MIFYQNKSIEETLKDISLSERQLKAICFLKTHNSISNSEYQELTGVSKRTATREIHDLTSKGILASEGGSRGRGKRYCFKTS